MAYVSAKYMPNDLAAPPGAPRQIQAVDDQGQLWALTEDSQVGDWLRYLQEGGTIDEADVPPDPPVPEPPAPVDPTVPTAYPDVLQDAPVVEE